ncbi:MAG: 6-phospho-beta-galactosidase [Chlamydiia bacterium]|nr:6-phospho-beta-galactosidase [Chlamydiia bacterium]MCH9617898.1 6-phospho-beta-galactosidase [Chlamydiia bacterium]MCH9624114.1 6-phospho-beta-galactosidase [Chlamydiia bacterium]
MKHLFLSIILAISSLSSDPFFWGVAISEYQNSGSQTVSNCNWAEWEKSSGKDSGSSNNHFENYETHIAALEELGCNAFRFSVEWSLIEKKEGQFDLAVVQRYREEILALKEKGITPFVTMHHFTEPLWFTEKGGFEKEENLKLFEEFAIFIFRELHEEVTYWAVINEPTVNAYMPYHLGRWPPEKVDTQKGFTVLKNLLESHVNVYEKCKAIDSSARIGFVHSFLAFEAYYPWFPVEAVAAYYMTKNWNESVVNFFLTGELKGSLPFAGAVDFNDDRAPFSFDFVGVNYYATPILAFTPFGDEWMDASCHEGQVMTDMPYHIDPEGFYETLIRCTAFDKPIYVTENGIADAKDDRRACWIKSYTDAMLRAKRDGSDIRGYFYWTLFDNFEWSDGYDMKFGLFDLDKQSGAIKLKEGAKAYQEIIHSGFFPLADIKKVFMKDKKIADAKEMVLYVKKSCPYCVKVLDFLEKNHIKITVKDAAEQENREYLLKNAHKTQVPCLFIKDEPMFESDDIISFIRSSISGL